MSSAPEPTLRPLLRRLSYWGKFDAADEQALLNLPHRTKNIERHGYIVRERERAIHSCLILSGFAIRHKIVVDGARQILAVQMKGEMVDLQNSFLGVADHSVQMITEGEIAFIPRDEVRKLAFAHPNIGMAMWFDTLVDASIFREWIANVGRRNAHTRLAHLLCEFALRLKVAGLGEETEYELPMSQEQLADCTGLTSVHVNRTLKALEAEGLIQRRSSRSVTIGDWKKLARAGDFDSNYLHLHEDEAALA
ncbi:Crp/Fnr family transcriptional regulator [Sphingosinicella rhizophila]|uniref:Crp/Fnr family transcriptional regulator n=1 Tax=Sphingosinicella rhizophila TaxID=3050082 RepID=A0ABU3Q545_9SPHN|nr:Crp/Fnr family transcriptional regulator [Sphingosinicella sp. GR2756]MDT9598538.1 Crp/Fnr family transcriptional regulator [Sphingosinicella sp. GR2756]